MTDEGLGVSKPFEGLKVLDLTHALSGPYATQLLADMGADVVKVENPHHQDLTRSIPPFAGDQSHYFLAINHGKRSIALDLRSDEGRETLLQLAAKADILIENFRPGVAHRMGLTPQRLDAVNSRLIRCSITGFGQTGGAARKAAYDVVMQAMSGFMSVTGEPGGAPLRSGVSIGDMVAGVYAVQAISTALYQRERTGAGGAIDVSMFDCLVSMLTYYVTLAQVTGKSPQPAGSMHATLTPVGSFRSADGWIVIAATTQTFWHSLCRALERPELADDPRFATLGDRQRHRSDLIELLSPIFETRTSAQWTELLDSHDVPNGPVLDLLALLGSPLANERHLFRPIATPVGELKVSRFPVIMSGLDGSIEETARAPELGEHSDEVFRDWLGKAAPSSPAEPHAGRVGSEA